MMDAGFDASVYRRHMHARRFQQVPVSAADLAAQLRQRADDLSLAAALAIEELTRQVADLGAEI